MDLIRSRLVTGVFRFIAIYSWHSVRAHFRRHRTISLYDRPMCRCDAVDGFDTLNRHTPKTGIINLRNVTLLTWALHVCSSARESSPPSNDLDINICFYVHRSGTQAAFCPLHRLIRVSSHTSVLHIKVYTSTISTARNVQCARTGNKHMSTFMLPLNSNEFIQLHWQPASRIHLLRRICFAHFILFYYQ